MKKHWMLVLMLVTLVLTSCGAKAVEQMTDATWEEGGMQAPSMAAPQESKAVEYDENSAAGDDITPMIIYNGSLNLVVLDSAKAQEDVQKLAEEFKGYVMASESYRYEQDLVTINMTLRVPAEQFNEVMSRLRKMALSVDHDSVSSENVTQEYVDQESRLKALEAKAARLEELMEDAEDTEAVLAVYRELSATQQEIEQVKGRMQYLERSASMATITVTLTPDALSRPVEVAGWRPQGTVKRAVEAMLGAMQFLGDAFIWILLFVVPILAVIGGVIYLIIKLLRRLFGRRKRSRQPAAPVTPAESK